MTEPSQRYNLRTLRELLQTAFSVEDLRGLFSFAMHLDLRPVTDQFTPEDSKPAMVRKAVRYCQSRFLLDELLEEIKDANPRAYEQFEDRLSAPSLPSMATLTPSQAPRPLAQFVGRIDELDRLDEILKPGTKTAISGLVGMGGLGKTELAKLAASRVAPRFRDGILWADCGEQDLVAIADQWAGIFGVQLVGDDRASKAAAWRGLISAKEALLIFDNLQPGQDLEPLFPPSGRSAVLITTRHGNHPDLRGAERLDLRLFALEEATALTERILGEEQARAQAADATRLFELLGFLPLAISVALHLGDKCGWTLATLNAKLQAAGALSVLGDEEALRKSLNATFQTAWANLPDGQQDTFRTLSLFNQGPSFSTQALADTLDFDPDDAGALLHRLAGRSLLTEEAKGRWSLHPLLREFVDTLEPPDDAARLRMARHYEQVARATNELYKRGGDHVLQALALFDLEWPHISAGQAWAATHARDDDEAAFLCSAYGYAAYNTLPLRLPARDHIVWLGPALEASRRLGDERAEAAHLGNLGTIHSKIGEWDRAIEFYEQALEIMERVRDFHGIARTMDCVASVCARREDWDRAIQFYEQSLASSEQTGDIHGMATTYNNLGIVYYRKGEWDRAIEFYEQSLASKERVGDIYAMAHIYGNLGLVYRDRGDITRAREYLTQTLTILEYLGAPEAERARQQLTGLDH